jgi:CHAT domain-containing protein
VILQTHVRGAGRCGAGWLAVAAFMVIGGCASSAMGVPIRVPQTAQQSSPAPPQVAPSAPSSRLTASDELWSKLTRDPASVGWLDHVRVCAVKYRFRRYDELFRCLDLFDQALGRDNGAAQRAAAWGDRSLQEAGPVWSNWMRAGAYAELGLTDEALRHAEVAWNALPEEFRHPSKIYSTSRLSLGLWTTEGQQFVRFLRITRKLAGGYTFASRDQLNPPDSRRNPLQGRDNPAALDMGPETMVMSLAAQRAIALSILGDQVRAKAAIEDLRQWATVSFPGGTLGLGRDRPFHAQAALLSIGPLYALGEYASVEKAYREAASDLEHRDRSRRFWGTVNNIISFGTFTVEKFLQDYRSDVRAFSTAMEDVSNALTYAKSLARLGELDEARKTLETILALPEIRDMGSLYWAALYERGQIALKDKQREEAVRLLSASVDSIEKTRSTISYEAAKIGFAGDKQAVYGSLVALYAQGNEWEQAFLVAERAKARALVDLLAQQRNLAPPTGADERVRQLLAEASMTDNTAGLAIDENVSRNLSSASVSRADLVTAAPEAASLVSVAQVPVASIAARLGAEDTLLDYYRVGDDLYAFVMRGTVVEGMKLSAKGLDEQVRTFRTAIESRAGDAVSRGRPLYERLIRPIQARLVGSNLTISPHGVLHYLPFAALSDGNQYLIDRFSIRLVPSAGTLVYLKTDRPTKLGNVLALGNPDLGNPKYDLPNAEVEAEHVAQMFPSSRALVRKEASKTAVKALGSGFSILHFATHGTFNTDSPLASGLYLAKGSEPDGLLTVSDLYGLRFDTDLVTLSACQTALGKVANGDDVIGLTRGFLYAGARSIVASLWEVDDAATEELMLSFYRNLKDHTSREALRLAQLETRAKYPHPSLWAAFQIVGNAD